MKTLAVEVTEYRETYEDTLPSSVDLKDVSEHRQEGKEVAIVV